ncbi:hypothetical protein ANN_19587 [Periplaneta americana]|uniref:Uncharacterized protein n=1 Tax=Periplaneta americana TaxID=6978 RepID=A0ABQ8SAA6_PERAM|nr:hypothetical protein ANN_19587 [Periplaneta americana]
MVNLTVLVVVSAATVFAVVAVIEAASTAECIRETHRVKWEVYEEVHCLTKNESTRRADIIAINHRNQRSLILDPTVHFERNAQQADNVPAAPPLSSAQKKMMTLGGTEPPSFFMTMQGVTPLLLSRTSWEILEHPLYSSHMSPCDYDLFAKVEEPLRGPGDKEEFQEKEEDNEEKKIVEKERREKRIRFYCQDRREWGHTILPSHSLDDT